MPTDDKPHVAMIGGDERELILLKALVQEGFHITAVGYPDLPELATVRRVATVAEAVAGADVSVAPMSNTDDDGVILSHLDPGAHLVLNDEAFAAMGPGKSLFIGVAKPVIERLAAKHRVRVVQLAELDEIAILNSIPTAEGAILRAMAELPVTLHGSNAIVIGFGRCGITLARMLAGIGAHVRVIARDRGQLARAREMGVATGRLSQLEMYLPDATVLFNTVPARVLGMRQLELLKKDALIVDIASAPGGTDFQAAKELGLKAFLDLGIPGKVAPRTAGEILAETVPELIYAACERGA